MPVSLIISSLIRVAHTLSDFKFILIEQVAAKTEKFLEYSEGNWQAQLWTYEPYGLNAKRIQFGETSRIFELSPQFRPGFAVLVSLPWR